MDCFDPKDAEMFLTNLIEEASFNTMTGRYTQREIDQRVAYIRNTLSQGYRDRVALIDARIILNAR